MAPRTRASSSKACIPVSGMLSHKLYQEATKYGPMWALLLFFVNRTLLEHSHSFTLQLLLYYSGRVQ